MKFEQENCKRFEACNAPICPMDEDRIKHIWYYEEDICGKTGIKDNFIKIQKKIKKLKPVEGYFTFEMLDQNIKIQQGLKGLDPDRPEESQLKTWFKKHPPKKAISEEKRQELRARGFKKKDELPCKTDQK